MVFPEEPIEGEGLIRAVRDPRTGRYLFQDPERGNIFIRRDEALRRLLYDAELEEFVDSFGNPVGVGSFGLPAAGYSHEFKYKTTQTVPLDVDPSDYQAAPGQTLQVRLVIVNPDGSISVVYKSFGENRPWDPETEQAMINEGVSETAPGQTTVKVGYDGLEGVEVLKSYSVLKVRTKALL
jgi:hypothetical protein